MNAIGNKTRQTVQQQSANVLESIAWMNATDFSPASLAALLTDVGALNTTLVSAERESGSSYTGRANKYAPAQNNQDQTEGVDRSPTQGRGDDTIRYGEVPVRAGAPDYDKVVSRRSL